MITSTRFTLTELLVSIAVLLVLISLLQPSFNQVMRQAHGVQCLTNLKSHGSAIAIYQDDYNGFYPAVSSWIGLSGDYGDLPHYGANRIGLNERPLNPYLGMDPKAAECPADLGDALNSRANSPAENCFKNYGTSYLIQFKGNYFRVRHLFHNTDPVHESEIHRKDNKIVMADWPWHPNRKLEMEQTRWHSQDLRAFNTLFADGHSELFTFPLTYETNPWGPYNPNDLFW